MTPWTPEPPCPACEEQAAHMLSFDVEEYFHVEAAADVVDPAQWQFLSSRVEAPLELILDMLAEHGASATFFVLGWLAKRRPELVRRIAAAGHEIASHGMDHQMIHRLGRRRFLADLTESRRLLEDISAGPVIGYRAPTFSICHRTAWAFDALAEAGFLYDSSVFPIRHDRYGVIDAPRWAHQAQGPGGGRVIEIPPLTWRMLGVNFPVGGGGYLRLLPARAVSAAIRSAQWQGRLAMIYLHPWELDPDQPALPMPAARRLRHRLNLRRTAGKLHRLLDSFSFGQARSYALSAECSRLEVYRYGVPTPAGAVGVRAAAS